jgi:hypothetical protein
MDSSHAEAPAHGCGEVPFLARNLIGPTDGGGRLVPRRRGGFGATGDGPTDSITAGTTSSPESCRGGIPAPPVARILAVVPGRYGSSIVSNSKAEWRDGHA